MLFSVSKIIYKYGTCSQGITLPYEMRFRNQGEIDTRTAAVVTATGTASGAADVPEDATTAVDSGGGGVAKEPNRINLRLVKLHSKKYKT